MKEMKERYSYWKYDYGLIYIETEGTIETSSYARIDHYWQKVGSICGEGKQKFPKLTTLMNCLSTLSHGNSDPERGFSINKNQLELHDSNIGKSTLETLWSVKDYLMRNGGTEIL